MDILGGSVRSRPKGTGRIDPGITQTLRPNVWKGNMFGFLIGTFNFFHNLLEKEPGPCFTANLCRIALILSFRHILNIRHNINMKKIYLRIFIKKLFFTVIK